MRHTVPDPAAQVGVWHTVLSDPVKCYSDEQKDYKVFVALNQKYTKRHHIHSNYDAQNA